jgi:phospholipase C
MPELDSRNALDHVVVVMFENRSFDNLLGYLYSPAEKAGFEGVADKDLSNPIPSGADLSERGLVPVHRASSMDSPDPDPGEEFPHINTQLFGTVSPPENRLCTVDDMHFPFNMPTDPPPAPPMNGFVADYINAFQVEMRRPPKYDEYAPIMACYAPEQLPVLSTLAKGFACFDHWFCEVPSQTYCNRSFFHAASSSGYVLNSPPGTFALHNDAPTIFERLEARHLSWCVYVDPEQLVPATALIHARQLGPFFADHFLPMDSFYDDAREGKLPTYSFIEPNMLHPHTDMHPPGAARLRHELHLPRPNAMLGGEQLLARIYDSVRQSSTEDGSNWANTFLLVTFDEHGGTYDHVPPPEAPPPNPTGPVGQQGFRFDRSGVRIPTLAISAWVEAGTVITKEYRSTSLIRTLRERWGLGPPLTGRDAVAPDLAPILTRKEPRHPEEWPDVAPAPLGFVERVAEALDRPLDRLERDLVGEALAHEVGAVGRRKDADAETLSRTEAMGHLRRIRDSRFPRLSD